MQRDYHVVILGGGLAGLTLAMQLKQQQPDISIGLLELRKNEAPLAAHKVGESTVELGTHYLRETLNLKDYLEENHLHKHGLRFYFPPQDKPIDQRVEYGARNELFVPSHQIDRGMFENDMMKKVAALGVDIHMGARVGKVDLSGEGHAVFYKQNGEEKQLTSDWVVDATGRVNLLKRQKGLQKEMSHTMNAIWFRVEGKIDVEDWSDNTTWKDYLNHDLRRLGTVHLMGKGYWVWLIPLSSGNTSVGIVADPRFHDFSTFNSLDKTYDWLAQHEPDCATHLAEKREVVLDFKILKNYAFNSTQFYSENKWGVVGEAGAFLDPFYSPGTDFIAIGNTLIGDLIVRDFLKEDIYTRTVVYDKVHSRLFDNWIPIYQDKYELFDNAQVMCVKLTWDFGVYWAIPSLLFTNGGFTNLKVLKAIFRTRNSLGDRFGALNKNVQDFYLDWGRMENESFTQGYVNPMSPDFIRDLQKGLVTIHESEERLVEKLEENLSMLEKMAAEIFRKVSARIKGTPADMPVNPYKMSLKMNTDELGKQGEEQGGLPAHIEISNALSGLWLDHKMVTQQNY